MNGTVNCSKLRLCADQPIIQALVIDSNPVCNLENSRGHGRPEPMQRDAQNVFEAQKYGGHFITNDRRVLARADQIYALCGLSPVKPTAFLAIVRKAMGDAGDTPARGRP